jgi:molybdenum cofactor cytidylyltransferase
MTGLVGVLLAAGRGARYDPSGARLKLLAPAPSGPHAGVPLAAAAARTLREALPAVVAVVRAPDEPLQRELQDVLRAAGCTLVVCADAHRGMAHSLAAGVRAAGSAAGWIVALADMPAVRADSVRAVAAALADGARVAVPVHGGVRGHPVGFAAALRSELLALEGDVGARTVLARHAPREVPVDDPGVLFDIDTADAGTPASAGHVVAPLANARRRQRR